MTNPFYSFDQTIIKLSEEISEQVAEAFGQIDRVAEWNTQKVLCAFSDNHVSESHFSGTTGYGYDDRGRDTLERVFSQIAGTEDCLFRHNFVSGTAAITTALFGVLRPNDIMLSITGTPYDTLHGVIGLKPEHAGRGTLRDFGIQYRQLDLNKSGQFDFEAIASSVKGVKVAYIQRSRGYSLRKSLGCQEIGEAIKTVKSVSPETIVIVDNCYGEFVELEEPSNFGADLIIGSLIKNPGGGIAPTGGYIAGKKELVELCACRLTSPSTGKEVGCTLDILRSMYLGLFFAPSVVASALKTAVFCAALFERAGYEVSPKWNEQRHDIIQSVILGSPERLNAFCRGIQRGAPVDSYVTPEAWDMPGYDDPVIMAAGAFHLGASIELSADGPMRSPYACWMQGGLTYPSGKTGILLAAQSMMNENIFFN